MENYDIELRGDLLDEYNAIQAAEEGNEPEEYTEEDAFRDFIMDQKEDFDG